MGQFLTSFTFGRNALKRTTQLSAQSALKAIDLDSKVSLSELKRNDNGQYNVIRDLITYCGILERIADTARVTTVGEAFQRLSQQNEDDAWRWLITRSLWLYVVPNGTDSAVNAPAKTFNDKSFSFLKIILGLVTHLYAHREAERFLYYEELCEILEDDSNWYKGSNELYVLLLSRRGVAPFIPPDRSLLGDLEPAYNIPRDNLNGVLNKAFSQTGLFDYQSSNGRLTGIGLTTRLDEVLQRRIRFILDSDRSWSGQNWEEFLQLGDDDFPQEVSLVPSQVVEELPPDETIESLIAEATADMMGAGLQVDSEIVRRFAASLLAKPFVILSGLSGSGKTQLALAFARWLSNASGPREDPFRVGTLIPADRISYRVAESDALSVVLSNPDGVLVALPRAIIEEWASYIKELALPQDTSARTIRDAVAQSSRFSPQLHSFETHLKASAYTLLAAVGDAAGVRRHELVAVGPDWTGRESSLGYPDALEKDRYVRATPILDLMLRAAAEPDMPYFLILDEMNLSHVEKYFSDFLSAMESAEPISLHSFASPIDGVPHQIFLPGNLFIVGTVNVDETTYLFSPKVLDRANAIEFRVTADDILAFSSSHRVDYGLLDFQGGRFAKAFTTESLRTSFTFSAQKRVRAELRTLFAIVSHFGAEFGFRTIKDVERFTYFHQQLSPDPWEVSQALDAQIYQKILPKLNGSRRKLEPVLCAIANYCFAEREWDEETEELVNGQALVQTAITAGGLRDDSLHPLADTTTIVQSGSYLPLSFAKVVRMLEHVTAEGFTSFSEA